MYPTKEQILRKDPSVKQIILDVVLSWEINQTQDWSKISNEEKLERLKYLIVNITMVGHQNQPWPNIIIGDAYYYMPTTMKICLDRNKPSIISTLHELGHHLYGPSELRACRWSIYLFRTCFPKMYKKLKWSNHLLIK